MESIFLKISNLQLSIILAILGGACLYGSWLYVNDYETRLQQDIAIRNATLYSSAINEFRSLYTSEVVERLANSNVTISHDYQKHSLGIPLPATLSMLLGERIGADLENTGLQLYSPYPFPFRQSRENPTMFSSNAWQALNQAPAKPFYQFTTKGDDSLIQFAIADVMRPACVNCHNTHPLSPKTDWQVGDVRGILEVTMPVGSSDKVAQQLNRNSMAIFTAAILLFLVMATLLILIRRYAFTLSQQVDERTASLKIEMAERELAQRKQLVDADRLKQIIECSLDAIVVIDADSRVLDWNPQMEQLSQWQKEEAVGQYVYDLVIPPDKRQQHREHIKEFLDKGTSPILDRLHEMQCLRKDGSTTPIEISIHSFEHAGMQLFSAFMRDISDRKQYEQQLIVAKTEAEQANQAKSKFLSNMSHEIRTPLNAVIGYSQLLKNDASIAEHHLKLINTIENSSNHLLELINEILDLSKIEADAMSLNESAFDLAALVNDIAAMFIYRCKEKKLQWEMFTDWDNSTFVKGDQKKLRQILINLLGNAVKFTDTGKISFIIESKQNDRYRFTIRDTGPGLQDETLDDLTKPFNQESAGKEKGGTGLGLSISSAFISMMGGKLLLDTQQKVGAAFFFEVALPPAESNAVDKASDKYERVIHLQKNQNIVALVVDDVAENRDYLSLTLQRVGVQVTTACDGEEALSKLHDELPDIIFMDLRMPGMSGDQAFDKIQTLYPTHTMKIVAVSAFSLENEINYYLQKGFDQFIAKPFKMAEIYQCMHALLNAKFSFSTDKIQENAPVEIKMPELAEVNIGAALIDQLILAATINEVTTLEQLVENIDSHSSANSAFIQYASQCISSLDTSQLLDALQMIKLNNTHDNQPADNGNKD